MTITTVKQRRAAGSGARLPPLAPLAAALLGVVASPASRADWTIQPAVELRETYTDNVALQPAPLENGQFVTEINPSLRVAHKGRRLTLDSTARFNYHIFSDREVAGTNRFYRNFSGTGRLEAIEDKLFIDANATYGPRMISPFGQQITSSTYAAANRVDVSTWSVAPSFVHRFGSSANLLMRYAHNDSDAGNSGFGTSSSDDLLVNLSSGRAFRTVGWGLRVAAQDLTEQGLRGASGQGVTGQESSTRNALASLRYTISPRLNLTSSLGFERYDYGALGGVTDGASWSAGFVWAPSRRTSLELSGGRRYFGATKTLRASHRSRRTVWSINYDDTVGNRRSTGMLPATFDTVALLDSMFLASYPDPEQRRLAVEAFMRDTGLPNTLTDSISFLSNRYFLSKSLNASAGFRLPRTTGTLVLYRTRSDALSSSATDSAILGSSVATRNDNTRQQGGTLTLTYTLSPRTSLLLTRAASETVSLVDGVSTFTRTLRLSATRKLSRQLTANFEVRNNHGSSYLLNAQSYRENAVAAYLTYRP